MRTSDDSGFFTDTLALIAISEAWEESIKEGCTFPFRNIYWGIVSFRRFVKMTREAEEIINDMDFLHAVLFTRIYGEPPRV